VSTSLRTRLTLSYVFVAFLCVLLVSALANGVLEDRFRRYVREVQETRHRRIAQLMSEQLRSDGTWDEEGVAAIGLNVLGEGVIVRVSDPSGRVVWDATQHNNGLCQEMLSHIAANMASRYPNWKGAFTENRYPLLSNFQEVGSVSIGYYGPFFLNDEELAFINTLNRLLMWVMLIALGLAVGVGFLMARGISAPLAQVVAATQQIAGGNLDVLLPRKSRLREIDEIAAAVNDLSRALKTQETLRKRLTADMAHELRTPLATLQSHLEALIDGVWAPDERRLQGLYEEILRINRMVVDVENLARYESDSLTLERRGVDLPRLVERIVENHQPQFRSKGVELRMSLSRSGPAAASCIDADKISQVVINLLSNALKFTPSGGSVEVGVDEAPQTARITVSDTGCGISPEDLPLVFERFYRADSSRTRSTGGSGIGLAIAKAIVEAHGGTIRAESEAGKGSRFIAAIPR
jgi:two-component system sensor histidine kinase BaeS